MAIIPNTLKQVFSKPSAINQQGIIVANSNAEHTKKTNETYTQYGTRICSVTYASINALEAIIPKIYNTEKQRQIDNQQIQQTKKIELQNDITEINNKIAHHKAEVEKCKENIKGKEREIDELKSELAEVKNSNGTVNKGARIKLIIGLVILAILTVYLFIFYSSTFYSAFFKEFNVDISIGAAMFDPQALPNALSNGFGELMFIICAPIIFMGLGYGLHYFSIQETKIKYFKIVSLVLVTFVFDLILAYLIANKIYDIWALTTIYDVPKFSLSIAIADINFWAVIFCGFIVYIIWGIVFGMTMTAYESLRSNKKEIDSIKVKIGCAEENLKKEKENLISVNKEIDILGNRGDFLRHKLTNNVFYDDHMIKVCMNDFFAGWMTIMAAMDKPAHDQQAAHQSYNVALNNLFQ